MVKFRVFYFFFLVIGLGFLAASFLTPGHTQDTRKLALVAEVEGAIGPATTHYIEGAIEEAEERGAEVLILKLNTPGGLVDSTRDIITLILESRVPVIGYVSPSGAHAASAGTYIMYATHVAAMAPGTNLGAATPIAIGGPPSPEDSPDEGIPGEDDDEGQESENQDGPGTNADALDRKSVNDAVAWIKSLAELRGRNAEWAEKAVREASSLTASEAQAENVIEIVAVDLEDLAEALDGREVVAGNLTQTLDTGNLEFEIFEPGLVTEILSILSNPNVALILMMVGVYGVFFEFANPGSIGPGVIGAIALILALYALNQLPLNTAGVILILLGIGFMIAEAFTPTMGALGVGGLVAFIFGAAMLVDTDIPGLQVSWPVIFGTGAVSFAVLILLMGYVWRAHHKPISSGREHLIGAEASVMEWRGDEGFVWAEGERWRAQGKKGLQPGEKVSITGLSGLTVLIGGKDKGSKKSKKGV